jgi:hypothetical protein
MTAGEALTIMLLFLTSACFYAATEPDPAPQPGVPCVCPS